MKSEPFSPPGFRRCFTHADGRAYALEVVDCRVVESWSSGGKNGGTSTSTRDDDASAQAFAHAKMRGLLKQGFVETSPSEGTVFDRTADVIATMRTDVDYKGETRHDFQPVPGRRHIYTYRNVSMDVWLMTTEDRRLAVLVRNKVHGSTLAEDERQSRTLRLLDALEDRRAEIFGDLTTPLRSFPLRNPIGRFTRLVVLSPTTENATISRDVSIANPVLGRSIFRAFPAFECETTGSETVSIAEARCSGRGAIPSSTWERAPHPVFDLALLKTAAESPQFLVCDPEELEARLGVRALARMRHVEARARNYAGEVRRILRGSPPPDLAELRAFLAYEPHPLGNSIG